MTWIKCLNISFSPHANDGDKDVYQPWETILRDTGGKYNTKQSNHMAVIVDILISRGFFLFLQLKSRWYSLLLPLALFPFIFIFCFNSVV